MKKLLCMLLCAILLVGTFTASFLTFAEESADEELSTVKKEIGEEQKDVYEIDCDTKVVPQSVSGIFNLSKYAELADASVPASKDFTFSFDICYEDLTFSATNEQVAGMLIQIGDAKLYAYLVNRQYSDNTFLFALNVIDSASAWAGETPIGYPVASDPSKIHVFVIREGNSITFKVKDNAGNVLANQLINSPYFTKTFDFSAAVTSFKFHAEHGALGYYFQNFSLNVDGDKKPKTEFYVLDPESAIKCYQPPIPGNIVTPDTEIIPKSESGIFNLTKMVRSIGLTAEKDKDWLWEFDCFFEEGYGNAQQFSTVLELGNDYRVYTRFDRQDESVGYRFRFTSNVINDSNQWSAETIHEFEIIEDYNYLHVALSRESGELWVRVTDDTGYVLYEQCQDTHSLFADYNLKQDITCFSFHAEYGFPHYSFCNMTFTIDGVTAESISFEDVEDNYTFITHHYGDWSTTTEASCGTAGSKERTCTDQDCQKKEVMAIPAFGEHSFGDWTTTQPSCTVRGSKVRTCSVCEAEEKENINALGHKPSDEWTVDVEPTETKKGSKSQHCTVCNAKCNETSIPKIEPTTTTAEPKQQAEKQGCGSTITLSLLPLALCVVPFFKKKEK